MERIFKRGFFAREKDCDGRYETAHAIFASPLKGRQSYDGMAPPPNRRAPVVPLEIKGFELLSPNIFEIHLKITATLLILLIIFLQGCIQPGGDVPASENGPKAAGISDAGGQAPGLMKDEGSRTSRPVVLDFQSSVSPNLFRTWGRLEVQNNYSFLMLNASLWRSGALVDSSRFLMIGVVRGQRSFEMARTRNLAMGRDYICRLEVSSPAGPLHQEERQCLAIDDGDLGRRYLPPSWSKPNDRAASDPNAGQKPARMRLVQETADVLADNKGRLSDAGLSSPDLSAIGGEDEAPGPQDLLHPGNQAPEDLALFSPLDHASDTSGESRSLAGYIASKSSRKYHLPSCRYAAKIRSDLTIIFPDAQTAEARGYLPCKVCLP